MLNGAEAHRLMYRNTPPRTEITHTSTHHRNDKYQSEHLLIGNIERFNYLYALPLMCSMRKGYMIPDNHPSQLN